MEDIKLVNSPTHVNGYRVVQDNLEILKAIQNGETIAHWEFGNSMEPVLHNKEYCIIEPLHNDIQVGDAVFCKVDGYLMTHMVWLVSNTADVTHYLIGSTNGNLYGWTSEVYGKAHGTRILENINE